MLRLHRFSIARAKLILLLLLTLGLSAPASAQNRAQASVHYESALMQFNEDDLEASLLELKQALKLNPDLLPARILLARIFLKLGDGPAAESVATNAQRLGADPALFWPIRAEALFQQMKFKELLALVPKSSLPPAIQSKLLVLRGRANLELGLADEAESNFKAAVGLTPLAPAPHVWLAVTAFRTGDLVTAQSLAESATLNSPEYADSWNILGSVAHALGRSEQALKAYNRALKLQPGHNEARISRAGLLIDLRLLDEAGKDINYLRKHFPQDPRGAYLESVYRSKRGENDKARESLMKATALLRDMSDRFINRSTQLQLLAGVANYELGSFERAQSYLQKYIKRLPRQAGPRKLLASILIRQKRNNEAIRILEPALKYAPRDSRLLLLLGIAWMQNGRHTTATGYLEKAAALDSDSPEVLTRLALSRLRAGNDKRGIRELDELFASDPENYQSAGLQLAITYLKRNRTQKAIRIATKLHELEPDNITVLNFLASAQYSANLIDEARTNYEKILGREPDFLPALINLAKLTAHQGKLDAARRQFIAIYEKHPNSVRTLLELAKLERRARHLKAAVRWLNKALDVNSKYLPTVLEFMSLNLQTGNAQEALRMGTAANTWAPEDLRLLAALARSQIALNRPDIARELYKKMSAIAGFDTEKLYELAQLQIGIRSLADALFSLGKGLKTEPLHLPSLVLLVDTLRQSGKLGDALERARTIIKNFPNQAAGYQLLGDVQLDLKRFSQALDNYRKSQKLQPSSILSIKLYQAGSLAGDEPGARQILADWVQAHPGDPQARKILADALLATGELKAAQTHYRHLLNENPNNVYALNNLANTLDRARQDGALELARRAHILAPENPLVSDTLGWLLVRSGQPAEGLKYLRDAHSRISANPEIRLHIATALADLGRTREALKELKSLLASKQYFAGIDDARRLLARISKDQPSGND